MNAYVRKAEKLKLQGDAGKGKTNLVSVLIWVYLGGEDWVDVVELVLR